MCLLLLSSCIKISLKHQESHQEQESIFKTQVRSRSEKSVAERVKRRSYGNLMITIA